MSRLNNEAVEGEGFTLPEIAKIMVGIKFGRDGGKMACPFLPQCYSVVSGQLIRNSGNPPESCQHADASRREGSSPPNWLRTVLSLEEQPHSPPAEIPRRSSLPSPAWSSTCPQQPLPASSILAPLAPSYGYSPPPSSPETIASLGWPDYCPSVTSTARSSPAPPTTRARHNNQRYSVEEQHFLMYLFFDMGLSWPETHAAWSGRFAAASKVDRRVSGLQGVLYRCNRCPPRELRAGLGPVDRYGRRMVKHFPIREQKKLGVGVQGLISRAPEFALQYDWVAPHKKEEAKLREFKTLESLGPLSFACSF